MMHLLAIVAASMGQPENSAGREGIEVAERLVAAIRGEAEFEGTDFVEAPGESDKAALRRFGSCRVADIRHGVTAHPRRRNVFVRNFNRVTVRFDCRRVPSSTPAAISLHLEGNRIAGIETHNADLIRADQ